MKKIITKLTYILLVLMLSISIAFSASQQTSQKDASVIITNARSILHEPSAIMWSDAELLVWVNDGTMDIVSRTHCLEAIEVEALVENQLSYALSDGYILVKAVVYAQAAGDEKGLIRGNIQSIGHVEEVGEPVYWAQEQDNIIVWPKPDAAHSGAGHDIDVYTVSRPTAVTASDDVTVPACYDRALTIYVAAQAFYKDGKFAKAGRFMAEYLAELDRYRMDFVTVPKESIDIVK